MARVHSRHSVASPRSWMKVSLIVMTLALLAVSAVLQLSSHSVSAAPDAAASNAAVPNAAVPNAAVPNAAASNAVVPNAAVPNAAVPNAAVPKPPTATATAANARAVKGAASAAAPVFAYYYLWWSTSHLKDMLGSNYPINAAVLPLPATLDASGCNPKSLYAGNSLTDVPTKLGGQDDPGVIETDVRQAAAAGLAGFAVNWAGSGKAGQTGSDAYSRRLQVLVDVVHKVNAQGIPFKLWLSYKASAVVLSQTHIVNDLAYINAKYRTDPAFDRSKSRKLTVIWQGSRKYSATTLKSISNLYRSTFRILGDETTWSTSRAPYLDGDAYYWSSQDPYRNPQSFSQLATLAAKVRASGVNPDGTAKVWVAPFTPGYDKQISGGSSCVPRKQGATMTVLYSGNAATRPDAFGLISWNEIAEGTYVEPMTRYGAAGLATLRSVIKTGT